MKGWRTAQELASLQLPGLPGSERGVQLLATRESWPSRKRQGRGGGREYPVSALPTAAQQAIATTAFSQTTPIPPAIVPDLAELKTYQSRIMESRAALLQAIDFQATVNGITRAKAISAFLAALKAGTLPADLARLALAANARRGQGRLISRSALFKWFEHFDAADRQVASLAPKPILQAAIPDWADPFMRAFGRPSAPCITEALAALPAGMAQPSYDQARRFLKKLSAQAIQGGRLGPRALKAFKVYTIRDVSKLWPGAIFVGDGHTFKAEVAHPIHGRPFRPEITVIIDVYTRRWVGWSIDLAENTWAVADALRHAVTSATCPDIFYYDNGSGAKNATWDADVTGLIARLSITKLHSAAWSSQARGVVERFNSTVLHKLARPLPTYVGPRMDKEARQAAYKITRRDIRDIGTSPLLISWPDFMILVGEAQAQYNAKPHSFLPKTQDADTLRRRHQSPQEAWDQAISQGWHAEPIGDEAARDLFRPAVTRTASRGWVKIFNNMYFAPELEAWHGRPVVVGYDIHDPNQVWVRDEQGAFIAAAIWNGNMRDYVPVSFAESARRKRVEGRVRRLEGHIGEALAEGGPILIHQAPDSRGAPAESSDDEARRLAWEADFAAEAEPAPRLIQVETRATRFTRALDIQGRLDTGTEVSGDDAKWLARYQRTPEYGAAAMLYEDFGADALETLAEM